MLQSLTSWTSTTSRTFGAGASAGAAAKKPQTPAKKPQAPAKKPQTPARKPQTPAKKPQTPIMGQDQLKLSPKAPPAKPTPPPEAPIAESTAKALEAALKGEPVRVKVPMVETPFALRVQAQEGAGRYEIGFGTQRVAVAIADGQASDAALLRTLNVLVQVPNDLRGSITAIRIEAAGGEADHFSVESTRTDGTKASVTFRRTGKDDELVVYEMSIDGHQVQIKAAPEEDLPWELARTAALFAQVPAKHRSVLKVIEINNGANPQDAYWAEKYNMPAFVSGATAGGGTIHFWNGQRNMHEDIFHHEIGHLIGQKLTNHRSFVPEGWEDAIKADNQQLTKYGGASPTEDFAEAWAVYMRLKAGKFAYQVPAKDEAELEARFPNRVKLLRAIYEAELAALSAQVERSGGVRRQLDIACACTSCVMPVAR